MPFPPPKDLPDPGIEPESLAFPALADRFLMAEPPGNPLWVFNDCPDRSRDHFLLLLLACGKMDPMPHLIAESSIRPLCLSRLAGQTLTSAPASPSVPVR